MGLFSNCKTRREQQKLNKATKLFLNGKVDNANRLLQTFEYKRSGDAAAIRALTTATDEPLGNARQTYHDLWEAKLSHVVNADLAAAVDAALDTVTPLVTEAAKDDIEALHKSFTDGDKTALFAACEEHVAYGHPDAIALQVAGYLHLGFESDDFSETYCYEYHTQVLYREWFYNLQNASKKGFSPAIAPLAEQTLEQLRLLGGDGIITEPVPTRWPDFDGYGDF